MANETLSPEFRAFRQAILQHLANKGWKRLLGKHIRYEQSLFEHSVNTLDVVITYLPIFRQTWVPSLSLAEEVALIITAVAHDAGKATKEFQRFIRGESEWVGHWDPTQTKALVSELYNLAAWHLPMDGLSMRVQIGEVVTAVQYTIRQERTQALEAREVLRTDHLSPRWRLLMDVVDDVDNLVSIPTVVEAARYLAVPRSPLSRFVSVAYHEAQIRGVSTVLLHEAAAEAFHRQGWKPLLFYPEGTLYLSDGDDVGVPAQEHVAAELEVICERELGARSHTAQDLVVGDIRQDFFPKPELFDAAHLPDYLRVAAKRAGAKPPEKVNAWNVIKVIDEITPELTAHLRSAAGLRKPPGEEEARRLEALLPSDLTRVVRQELGSSQPEMAIFKFFKNVVYKLCPPSGSAYQSTAYGEIERLYNARFGSNSLGKLMHTSTLMPAEDYLAAVRLFHELAGDTVGHPEAEKVAFIRPEERQRVLVDLLAGFGEVGFQKLAERPSFAQLSRRVAAITVRDLIVPMALNLKDSAERQLKAYAASKRDRTREAICPICNAAIQIEPGQCFVARADFYGGRPEAFSNRRVAHGRKVADTICPGCYYERILQQVLLTSRPEEIIVIFPSMNLSPHGGSTLVGQVRSLEEHARRLTAPESAAPDQRFDLTASWRIAALAPVHRFEQFGHGADVIASALTYRPSEDRQKEHRRNLLKCLKDEFENLLDDLNEFYGTRFDAFDDAADAVIQRAPEIWQHGEAGDLTRRLYRQAFKLSQDWSFVVQTANLILVPIAHGFGGSNRSETKAGLARLLTALFFSLALDTAVAVVPFNELAGTVADRGLGVAYVPPYAGLRQLIGADWVSLADADRWFRAISAAFQLGTLGKYPERNDVFQVLTEPSVGRIIRRIEEAGNGPRLGASTIPHIEALREVIG